MNIQARIESKTLHFKNPAGTSRGVYHTHQIWYLQIRSNDYPGRVGIGECAPLPDLSCDGGDDYEDRLMQLCRDLELSEEIDTDGFDFLDKSFWHPSSVKTDLDLDADAVEHPYLTNAKQRIFCLNRLRTTPSMLFGLEIALLSFQRNSPVLWESDFTMGKVGIPINGLIWMGPIEEMKRQICDKLHGGYSCIKLKIGALNFNEELELLWELREKCGDKLMIRVDANGAFSPKEAFNKLMRLSELNVHSIEQPIKPGQLSDMFELIHASPILVALDEELIGHHTIEEKDKLLDTLKPHYLVLKPTLHGGIAGCMEWIRLASIRGIGWWITSALESNVGLSAVAQWTATLGNTLHQGLGTGALYTDNVESPLRIEGGRLWYRP